MNLADNSGAEQKAVAPLLHDLETASRILGGLGRTSVFRLLQEGQLRATKIGRRTFVSDSELRRYVASLEQAA